MKLYYRETGKDFPFIILHGLFGMSDNWMSFARKLGEEYRVIMPDLRNHGNSPQSNDWNYEAMADDLHELVESLDLDKFNLMGHSMGGKVAMNYAQKHPDHLNKLIVVDIAPRYYPVHHQKIIDALKSVNLSTIKTRSDAEDQLEKYIDEWGVRQFLLKNLGRNSDGYYWKFNLDVISDKIENVGEALSEKKVSIPALFVGGSKSDYIGDSDKEEIKKIFADPVIVHIKDAGHWVHADKPDELMDTITQFLNYKST